MPGTPLHWAAAVISRMGFPVRLASARPSFSTPYQAMPDTTRLLPGTLPPYEAPVGGASCALAGTVAVKTASVTGRTNRRTEFMNELISISPYMRIHRYPLGQLQINATELRLNPPHNAMFRECSVYLRKHRSILLPGQPCLGLSRSSETRPGSNVSLSNTGKESYLAALRRSRSVSGNRRSFV